jgi:hypothetical protein
MKMTTPKKIAALVLAGGLLLGASGCATKSEALIEREKLQSQSAKERSLEKDNLAKKKDLENNPETLRYVYIMNFGQIVGYYTAMGKISSSASQIAPEQDYVKIYDNSSERVLMDSAKDDGSYGPGDPGIFFFTPEGTMIETSLDYIVSTNPINLDVKRLG